MNLQQSSCVDQKINGYYSYSLGVLEQDNIYIEFIRILEIQRR